MILHQNHSLLTRYDFCHSCIVMFPPIDVPCLLGPQDGGAKNKSEKKNQKTHQKNTIVQNSFCRNPKFKDLWKIVYFCLFVLFFCFLEAQDSHTSGPPIGVPCLLGPPDRGTKKIKKQKTKKTKQRKKQYFKTLSAETPSSKTSGKLFFCFCLCFLETKDSQTSGPPIDIPCLLGPPDRGTKKR